MLNQMKSYTDLEQSKKLAKILPPESADMFYRDNGEDVKLMWEHLSEIKVTTPCWSLTILLEVLPLGIYDELDGCNYELEINMIDKMPRYVRLGDLYHSQFPYDFEKDTLLDNVVESIIWLNNNDYFEL